MGCDAVNDAAHGCGELRGIIHGQHYPADIGLVCDLVVQHLDHNGVVEGQFRDRLVHVQYRIRRMGDTQRRDHGVSIRLIEHALATRNSLHRDGFAGRSAGEGRRYDITARLRRTEAWHAGRGQQLQGSGGFRYHEAGQRFVAET
ncbi:hypothetical protein D9M70_473040 [compost metagenome]